MEYAIQQKINKLNSTFINVSDVNTNLIQKKYTFNKIYAYYIQSIKIAKLILQRYDYSIENITNKAEYTYPYWIDMSRLYEMYVYNKLHESYGNEIIFQAAAYQTSKVDYLRVSENEQILIAAKY